MTDVIEVFTEPVTVIEVFTEPVTVVEVVTAGPPGPPGAAASGSHVHIQTTPAASWLVTHNLNSYPQVTVLDVTGARVWPDLDYPNLNSIVLTHAAPLAGTAVALG